jgi:hypothetical protein
MINVGNTIIILAEKLTLLSPSELIKTLPLNLLSLKVQNLLRPLYQFMLILETSEKSVPQILYRSTRNKANVPM